MLLLSKGWDKVLLAALLLLGVNGLAWTFALMPGLGSLSLLKGTKGVAFNCPSKDDVLFDVLLSSVMRGH